MTDDLSDGGAAVAAIERAEVEPVLELKHARSGSDDFKNILDNIVDNNTDFDKESDIIQSGQPPTLPKDAFASSFAPSSPLALAEEHFPINPSISTDDKLIDPEQELNSISSLVQHEDQSPSKPPLRRKVSLEEMAMEAGIGVPEPITEKPKKEGKKPSKLSHAAKEQPPAAVQELQLPPLVGHKAPKATKEKRSQDVDLASKSSDRRRSKDDGNSRLKLPPLGVESQSLAHDRSREAEDILAAQSSSHLPNLPHSSPAQRVNTFQPKKHGKPLYLRMIAKAQRKQAMEEQAKVSKQIIYSHYYLSLHDLFS